LKIGLRERVSLLLWQLERAAVISRDDFSRRNRSLDRSFGFDISRRCALLRDG